MLLLNLIKWSWLGLSIWKAALAGHQGCPFSFRPMQRFLKVPQASAIRPDEFRSLYQGLLDKMPAMKGATLTPHGWPSILVDVMETKKVGIAVSGGSDSVALAWLASQVIPHDRLMAFMVDHRLGPQGVTEDPAQVTRILGSLGIPQACIQMPSYVLRDKKRSPSNTMGRGVLGVPDQGQVAGAQPAIAIRRHV